MTVTLYNITDDPRKLNKTLPAGLGPYNTVNALDIVSIVNPTLILEYSSGYIDCNYCYVLEFGRYYFCKVSVDTGGRIVLTCTVDPLMSFATEIKNCPACILRNENIGSNYVVDKKLPIDSSRFFTEGKKFPESELTKQYGAGFPYILIVR